LICDALKHLATANNDGQITLWQVVRLMFSPLPVMDQHVPHLGHKPLCALISSRWNPFLGSRSSRFCPKVCRRTWGQLRWRAATGYGFSSSISKYVHIFRACAAIHFDAMQTRQFSEIADSLVDALAIHKARPWNHRVCGEATTWSLFPLFAF